MDLSQIKSITIPQGTVKQIAVNGTAIWKKPGVKKSNLIGIDLNGDGIKETYRVLKVNDNIAEILAMKNEPKMIFGSNQIYENYDVDWYLNVTWYNTLSATAKAAIVDKTFYQDSWSRNTSGNPVYSCKSGTQNPGTSSYNISLDTHTFGNQLTRHVYAITVQDVLDYILDTTITDGKIQNYNIWKMFNNNTISISESYWLCSACAENNAYAWYISNYVGELTRYIAFQYSLYVRPAMTIDLSKIDFEIVE